MATDIGDEGRLKQRGYSVVPSIIECNHRSNKRTGEILRRIPNYLFYIGHPAAEVDKGYTYLTC